MGARPGRIVPLTRRLPALLGYPLRSPMLWMLLALCAFRLLNHLPNLLGLAFELAFWVMGFKLAVEALVNTAHGRLEPLGANDLVATDGEALEQLVLLVVVYLPIIVVALAWGPLPAQAMLVVAVLVLPAAVVLLAMDHSLPRALNPVAWAELVGRLGGAYLNVVVILALMLGAAAAARWGFDRLLPGDMDSLPSGFASLYVLVAGYHVLGYLIHEHHQALGLDITPAVPRATYANPQEDEAMLAAAALAADGQHAAAADRLQDLFRGRGASDDVHDRYRTHVLAAADVPRLVRHAQDYVCSLLATGKDRRALAVVAETRLHEPGFQPAVAADVARLVAQAARTGQSQLAVALAEDFEARFPDSEDTPQVVLAASTLMAEKLGRESEARERLRRCLALHGAHPLAPGMREALAQVEKWAAVRGPQRLV